MDEGKVVLGVDLSVKNLRISKTDMLFAQFFFKVTEKFSAELQKIDNLFFFVILQSTFCTETKSQKICKLAEKFLLDVVVLNFLWCFRKNFLWYALLLNFSISLKNFFCRVAENLQSLTVTHKNFVILQKTFYLNLPEENKTSYRTLR